MADKLQPMTWPKHRTDPSTVVEIGRTTRDAFHASRFLRYGVDITPLPDDDRLELIGRREKTGKRG